MTNTTQRQNAQAAQAIDEVFNFQAARVIDNPNGSGYAILTEDSGFDAIEISHWPAVHARLPRGTFLEPVNSGLLRLVRA